jgi:hypothetical protein
MLFLDAAPPTTSNTAIYISIASTVISLGAILVGIYNNRLNLKAKNKEDRKAEIYKILNDLYGPFGQLRAKSSLLYEKFKTGKKANTGDQFSTLMYLLEHGLEGFSENDKALLAEIIKIGGDCEKLIVEKAGLIDDEALRKDWFPKVERHYLIIRLAYQGVLKGQSDLYQDTTFQYEIDGLIEQRIKALHEELGKLNG